MSMAVLPYNIQYTTKRHKPFEGRVKVYVVAEDDEDRSRVLHFETENFFMETSSPDYNFYGQNTPVAPTKYAFDIGDLEVMDGRGRVFVYENFLNEEVVDEPTYNEEDYD